MTSRPAWITARFLVVAGLVALFAAACSGAGTGSQSEGSGSGADAAGSPSATMSSSPESTSGTTVATGSGPRIAAVGDLVCAFGAKKPPIMVKNDHENHCDPRAVSRLVNGGDYDAFLTLGDLQYSYGGYWRYLKYWDRYYGDVVNITRPAPGNHEAYADFTGYVKYFGPKRTHMPAKVGQVHIGENPGRITGYYSFEMGDWHVVSLNSVLCGNHMWNLRTGWTYPIEGGGCDSNDPMMRWLRRDLEQSEADCTLAYWHHPRFTVRTYEGPGPKRLISPLVDMLDEHGVDVILNGHTHDYQRWGPLDASGTETEDGFVQFVVGTGGDSYEPVPDESEWPSSLKEVHTGTYGLLEMQLNPGGYTYEFVPAPGEEPYSDAGTGICH